MKSKTTTLLIAFASFVFSSCIKPHAITVHNLDPATIPYFGILKEGNWWVYSSSNHERDSIYVSSIDATFMGGPKYPSFPNDEFQDYVYTINTAYYFVPIPPDAFESAYWIINPNGQSSQTDFTMGAFSVLYNNTTNTFDKFNSALAYQIDSVIINSTVYKNVIFSEDSTGYDKKVYWAKNVGMVRWITNTADTFNLVKYYIK